MLSFRSALLILPHAQDQDACCLYTIVNVLFLSYVTNYRGVSYLSGI